MKKMMQTQMIFGKKLQTKRYSNGHLGVFVQEHDGEPIAELSIMNESTELAPNEFILKDYYDNAQITQEHLIQKRLIPTDRFVLIGSHLCPICQIGSEV